MTIESVLSIPGVHRPNRGTRQEYEGLRADCETIVCVSSLDFSITFAGKKTAVPKVIFEQKTAGRH